MNLLKLSFKLCLRLTPSCAEGEVTVTVIGFPSSSFFSMVCVPKLVLRIVLRRLKALVDSPISSSVNPSAASAPGFHPLEVLKSAGLPILEGSIFSGSGIKLRSVIGMKPILPSLALLYESIAD